MDKKEYISKFKRCILEYTNAVGALDISEEGEDEMGMGGDPNAMGGADPTMGGDPNAMGGADPTMGGDPNAMGGADPTMGGAPNAANGAQSPEGFSPQGVDPNSGLDGMGGDPNAMGGADPNIAQPQGETPGADDDVIDVDELTDSQEETEKKVDALASKFEKLMGSLDGIEKRISDIDAHTNEYLGSIKGEMEKRNPTPMQRLTMRSTKSAPYSMSPNEYMNNYAPDNYSDDSDNNGADDPQYQITKDDIDKFTDYQSVAKDLDMNKMGLRDILGL